MVHDYRSPTSALPSPKIAVRIGVEKTVRMVRKIATPAVMDVFVQNM